MAEQRDEMHKRLDHLVSRIRILQDKIHKVITDIRNINNRSKIRGANTHKYKVNPNIYHNSGRNRLSGENHHPRLDPLVSEEDPGDPSPEPSISAACSVSTVDTSALSSSHWGQRGKNTGGKLRSFFDLLNNLHTTKPAGKS